MLGSLLPILLLAASSLGRTHCPSETSTATSPIDLFDVSTIFADTTSRQDIVAANLIRNTLSLYPYAIDGKNFASLSNVFVDNVFTNYSPPVGILNGLPAVEAGIQKQLAPVRTQHLLGTQAIDVKPGSCEAKSLSYFTATHFGLGKYEGQVRPVPYST